MGQFESINRYIIQVIYYINLQIAVSQWRLLVGYRIEHFNECSKKLERICKQVRKSTCYKTGQKNKLRYKLTDAQPSQLSSVQSFHGKCISRQLTSFTPSRQINYQIDQLLAFLWSPVSPQLLRKLSGSLAARFSTMFSSLFLMLSDIGHCPQVAKKVFADILNTFLYFRHLQMF